MRPDIDNLDMLRSENKPEYRLEDRFSSESERVYLTGIQALARVLVDHQRAERRRGHNSGAFVSGYPGSPLAGLDLQFHRNKELLEEFGVVHQPAINEELALTAVMGTQLAAAHESARYDGVAAMWYGKAPGLDRASDALKHGNYVGASRGGGVVVAVGDDPQCKSSSLPSSSDVALYDALMPILSPGSVQEVLDLGLHGLLMSRTSGLWVGFKIVTNVADAAVDVEVDPKRLTFVPVESDDAYPITKPHSKLLPPVSVEMERDIHETRLPLALEYARINSLNQIVKSGPSDWLGLIAAGRTYFDLKQSLVDLGVTEDDLSRIGIRILKLSMPYPFDKELAQGFATGLEEIVVLEEKRSFIESFVRDALYGLPNAPRVLGKTDDTGAALVPSYGAVDADTITKAAGARILKKTEVPSVAARLAEMESLRNRSLLTLTPARTPYFCSGCPHNRSVKVPEGSLVSAGIGCHAMALIMSPEQVGEITGLTQMGGEGSQWIGMSPFVDTDHLLQNVGDGTFFHSAHLSLRGAVAAGVNITFKLLYNSAVAMTGGQDVPGGHTVAQLTQLLTTEGVKRIIVTTEDLSRYKGVHLAGKSVVWHRDRLEEAQNELASTPGVTVLIHDQQCAAEKRKMRKRGKLPKPTRKIVINSRVCEGCGDCGAKSNCLSLQPLDTEFGRKTTIHQSSCNLDESCLLGDCPSFVSVDVSPRKQRRAEKTKARTQAPPSNLPEPEVKVPVDDYAVRLVGIGGTGVVTVCQVLGTAALLEGKHVSGLDQTGLSQKGGPVTSDLRITATADIASAKLSSTRADTYLALDILAGSSASNLTVSSPERTIAIVSTERTATGHMIADNSIAYPAVDELRSAIDAASRAAANAYVNPSPVSEGIFHNHMFTNVVTLGAAYQAGAIPVKADSIEQALEINGVAVQANIAAFRWGRALIAAPDAVASAVAKSARKKSVGPVVDSRTVQKLDELNVRGELRRMLEVRVPDLIAYQDVKYADRYLDIVREVLIAERSAVGENTSALVEEVAFNLYKLMAYKDEYEVARLHLDTAFEERIADELGATGRVYFHLHPPILRSMGLKRKLKLGLSARPSFRLLAAGRRLRGTALDPFGQMHIRKVERALIDEYIAAIRGMLEELSVQNHGDACRVAALPDMVRGYEHVKLNNVNRYQAELTELLEKFDAGSDRQEIS